MIKSLSDTDLYKLTMQQFAFHNHPNNMSEYKLIIRSGENLKPYRKALQRCIKNFQLLKFKQSEIDYLRSLGHFKEDYLSFLQNIDLTQVDVEVSVKQNLEIRVKGLWEIAILFEVPLLAMVQEIYWTNKYSLDDGRAVLEEKIEYLKNNAPSTFSFVDFGTRRRLSFDWHKEVLTRLKETGYCTGTSNVLLAQELNLPCKGTMAHEYFQAWQVLGSSLEKSQVEALQAWKKEYGDDLDVALTDIFTIDKFVHDYKRSKVEFSTFRHDSGSPFVWAEKIRSMKSDAKLLFSDGLNFKKAIELEKAYPHSFFGIGTYLMNDFKGHKALSLVMKLVKFNGEFTIKHSDEPGKITCESPELIEETKTMVAKYAV